MINIATYPSETEIRKLTAFLPLLTAECFTPIRKWHGGEKNADGSMQFPWPEYHPVVRKLVELASGECWTDPDYINSQANVIIASPSLIANADLRQLKSMLTYFVRGERFVTGHWGALLESGAITLLLDRLAEIESHMK